jgi:hypothetical protein
MDNMLVLTYYLEGLLYYLATLVENRKILTHLP